VVKANKQTHVKVLAMAISVAMMPWVSTTAFAAGLGRLTVYSAMGQPLRAQLEITASSDEVATLSAQLASADAFRLAGIEYSGALAGLRFSKAIKEEGVRKYIEVTTDRPLNEPFVDMLVELNWSAGRLVREYTFLLDPLDIATNETLSPVATASLAGKTEPSAPVPQISSVPAKSASQGGSVASPPPAKKSAPAQSEAKAVEMPPAPAAKSPSTVKEREIRAGETLGKISREYRSEGISLEQMLVALFRENPDAFDGNMNRMRAGRILRVPDTAVVEALDPVEARKEVIAQAGDFSAYRSRVAEGAAKSSGKDVASAPTSQGKLTPKVEESAPLVKPGTDKLAVSRSESQKDSAVDSKAKARVGALEEDLVARDRALKDANGRIADLEKNLNDLKKLAELKSQAGAAAQKAADAAKMATPAKPVEVSKPPEPIKVVEAGKPTEPVKAADSAKITEPPLPVAPAVADKAADATVPAVVAPEAKPVEEAPKPAPKPKKPVVIEEPVPEPDFIEENGLLLAGGGGVLALLLGYLGFSAYRRKKSSAVAEEEVPLAEASASVSSVASVFSDTVAGSVASSTVDNAGQSSVLDTLADGGSASIDPLDEADTYLAFGKDSQAEEILLDALKETPARWAIHLKLLEIYAARRGTVQFNTLAEDLRAQTGAAGAEWSRAAEMGRLLDPNNALYSAKPEPAGAVAAPISHQDDMAATMVFSVPPPVAASIPSESEPEVPATEADDSAAVLDFDLGLDEPAKASVSAATAPESEPVEVAALDFDLDLGDGGNSNGSAASAPGAVTPLAAAAPLNLSVDFDLELPEAKAEPEPEIPVPLTLDLSLPDADSGEVSSDGERSNTSAPIEIEVQGAAQTSGIASEVPDFDFDLGEAPATSNSASESSVASVDIPLDAGENPEAATKLELAFAYEEMGDRDGARELFQEVVAEGSASQQAAAKARLEQLG
jgi:pilus assembly protein FimV